MKTNMPLLAGHVSYMNEEDICIRNLINTLTEGVPTAVLQSTCCCVFLLQVLRTRAAQHLSLLLLCYLKKKEDHDVEEHSLQVNQFG